VASFGISDGKASGFVTRDVVSHACLSDEASQITQGKIDTCTMSIMN
jgi:hypothetical protein